MWMPVICMHARRVELERIRGQWRSCSRGKPPRQNKPRGRKTVSKCARPFLLCFRTRCFVLRCRRGSSGAAVWGAGRLCAVCNPPCFLFPDVCLSHVLQSIWPAAREHRLMVEIRIETSPCLSRSPSSCFSHVFFYFCVYFFLPVNSLVLSSSDFSHSLPTRRPTLISLSAPRLYWHYVLIRRHAGQLGDANAHTQYAQLINLLISCYSAKPTEAFN